MEKKWINLKKIFKRYVRSLKGSNVFLISISKKRIKTMQYNRIMKNITIENRTEFFKKWVASD